MQSGSEVQPKSVVAEITKLMRRPRCKHGTLDPNGRPWPQRADKAQSVVEANHIHPDYLDPDVGKCLDTTLFRPTSAAGTKAGNICWIIATTSSSFS